MVRVWVLFIQCKIEQRLIEIKKWFKLKTIKKLYKIFFESDNKDN